MKPTLEQGDRYSLEGLISLYEFEPTLRDVYVEGRSDAGIMRWYLRECGHREVKVYAIDDRLDMPSSILEELNLDVGARGRVIALAVHADQQLPETTRGLTAIADADFHHIQGDVPAASHLLLTDQPAVETYVLRTAPLEKLIRSALHISETQSAEDVQKSVIPALRDLLAARCVLQRYKISVPNDISDLCTVDPSSSSLDVVELIRRSLGRLRKSDQPCTQNELLAEYEEARAIAETNRQNGRGHDVAPILIKRLGLSGPKANKEALEMTMRACFSKEDLDKINIFAQTSARLSE